jgi:tryptophan-rich sensory protein
MGLKSKLAIKILRLAASILIPQLAGAVGSVITIPSINRWYRTLRKPGFNPPSSVFAPVWTILYFLMGISLYLVLDKYRSEDTPPAVKTRAEKAIEVFGVQLGLNSIWSFLFFGLKSPLYGLVDIILLWISIVATIVLFAPISPVAAILLAPYIAWVSFAAVLNYSIFQLNRK